MFDLRFPGLRQRIGVVAYDVKKREFRRTHDYDNLPKVTSSNRKDLF